MWNCNTRTKNSCPAGRNQGTQETFKIPTEDAMARKVVKMELAMQEKHSNEKRRYEALKKVRAKR